MEVSSSAHNGGKRLHLGPAHRTFKVSGTVRDYWTLGKTHDGITWLRTLYTSPNYLHT